MVSLNIRRFSNPVATTAVSEPSTPEANKTSGTTTVSETPRRPLSIASVANLFLKMRHHKEQATVAKPNQVTSSSGDAPISHAGIAENLTTSKRLPLQQHDEYVCMGGVNAAVLLRATRTQLMQTAELLGANALVDEHWEVTITCPKNKRTGSYRVVVTYTANATRSSARDPRKPVALEQAKGVDGLMTIVRRNED
ncbi:hypothetical protein EV715DRAFT_255542 [Schizophyllum commune]